MMSDPLRPTSEDAAQSWADRVRANREQVDRVREVPDGSDFYGPIASSFRADPHRTDDPTLNALRELVQADETWLDIGAGGGQFSLPIALLAKEVIALDPSDGMLGILREGMRDHGIGNVRIVPGRWPMDGIQADVAFICQVGYDIEGIGPFLDGMDRAAPRRVAVMFDRAPTGAVDVFWPEVHGEPRAMLPALREFLALLLARGHLPQVRLIDAPGPSYDTVERAIDFARRQTWVKPGSEKDRAVETVVRSRLVERNGRFAYRWDPLRIGIVRW